MKTIKISAELERQIRSCMPDDAASVLQALEALLDADRPVKTPGMSYQQILAILKDELGGQLAYPTSPHVSWIVRQVNRVKELGLGQSDLVAAAKGARAGAFRKGAPIELEYILRNAVRFLAKDGASDGGNRVVTGRDGETEDMD